MFNQSGVTSQFSEMPFILLNVFTAVYTIQRLISANKTVTTIHRNWKCKSCKTAAIHYKENCVFLQVFEFSRDDCSIKSFDVPTNKFVFPRLQSYIDTAQFKRNTTRPLVQNVDFLVVFQLFAFLRPVKPSAPSRVFRAQLAVTRHRRQITYQLGDVSKKKNSKLSNWNSLFGYCALLESWQAFLIQVSHIGCAYLKFRRACGSVQWMRLTYAAYTPVRRF